MHSHGIREPHHRSMEACAHKRPGNLLRSTFKFRATSKRNKMPAATPALKYQECMHAGLREGSQHMPGTATSRKWTHKGGERRAISVWGSQTEYKYKHTHATLNVHHAGTQILTLCSRDDCRSTYKHKACTHTAFRKTD